MATAVTGRVPRWECADGIADCGGAGRLDQVGGAPAGCADASERELIERFGTTKSTAGKAIACSRPKAL